MRNTIIKDRSVAVDSSAKQVCNNNNDAHLIVTITTVQQLNKLVHTHSLQHLKCIANHGFYLLPVKPPTDTEDLKLHVKHSQATTDTQLIEQWYNQYKEGWWAIATGERFGLTVVDIDLHGDKDGFESLEKKGIILASTFEQRTPRDGLHLGYNYNPLIPNKSDVDRGVDTRNNGGFILIEPTTRDGKTYKLEKFPFNREKLPEVPEAFIRTYFSKSVHNAQKKKSKQVQLSQESAPPCVGFLITNGVPQDVEYNAGNLILATSCKTSKLSEEVALKLSLQMAKHTSQDHDTQKNLLMLNIQILKACMLSC